MRQPSLVLTGNEPRQRYLFEALSQRFHVPATIDFDIINLVTKSMAAALSLSWPRSEWWENYQMHPLVQARRQRVLSRSLELLPEPIDALLMWGSWFKPASKRLNNVPFFCYIDQSHSLVNLPGERRGRFARRRRSHELQARTYSASTKIFTMSEWAREQTLEAHHIDASKVIAVGWGPCSVDLSTENFAEVEREPIVLHISNDFYRKGIDFLVATSERVHAVAPNVRFVVIGEDVGGRSPPSSSYVQFLGRITDRAVLTSYFRRASVFFLPHRFDRSPHVLVEAMSAGLPLVASAQGGAIELIQGHETGFLVNSGDIDGYAKSLLDLLQNSDLQRRMGGHSQDLMKNKYNWPSIAEILQRIIGGEIRHDHNSR